MTNNTLEVRTIPDTPYGFIACAPADFELLHDRQNEYATNADIALAKAYADGWVWAEEIQGESAEGEPTVIVMLERPGHDL